MTDINISGNSCSIDCFCSRFDIQNYNVIIETWIKKSDLQSLRGSITPQAVGELYKVLGRPKYYDSTWSDSNTIKISLKNKTKLSNMKNNTVVYVKNISDSPIEGASGWIDCKIECNISGTGYL